MTPNPEQTTSERLRAEHELDDVAVYDARAGQAEAAEAPGDDGPSPAGAAEREPDAASEPELSLPPPRSGLPRRTRALGMALLASLFFLAGLQCQKLMSGGPSGPAGAGQETTTEGAASSGAVPGGAGLARGEITAVRGSVLYVRDGQGATIKVRVGRAAQVARGSRTTLGAVAPGERVVLELRRDEEGRLTADSVTVLVPRSGRPAR